VIEVTGVSGDAILVSPVDPVNGQTSETIVRWRGLFG
jgi:hypothetical protein